MSYQDGLGTWLWNKIIAPEPSAGFYYDFEYVSDAFDFKQVACGSSKMYYVSFKEFTPRVFDNGWENEAYRIIHIKTPPPANFLAFLQASATYQEPAIHKLTINGKPATINGKSKGTLTFGGKIYHWDNSTPAPTDELLGTSNAVKQS